MEMKVLLTRAVAVILVIVAHGFLLSVPTSASVALGVVYLLCVIMLAIAAWTLWTRTVDEQAQQ